ncbi:MAG: ABC transporter ATP-binding protein [Rhodoblastus sp.]
MPTHSVLSFQNIAHAYGDFPALHDISLDVGASEIVALLGPSGCGKSTLLRIAAGLEHQTSGRVLIAGRAVSDETGHMAPEKRGVGLVFQDYALFPHLDIFENVAFGLRKKTGAAGTVMEMLARVGLGDRARDYPHMLSGGEQQRVALARALAPRPAALLLDEPFSNLDQSLRRDMRAETVALLKEAGAAAILVTHDPDDAAAVADRIAIMRAGAIVQAGPLADIYRRPADPFVLGFFCAIETFPAQARDSVAQTPFGSLPAPATIAGEAVLCVRKTAFSRSKDVAAFEVRILARRFLGAHVAVQARVAGYAKPFEILLGAQDPAEIGDTISLALDPQDVFVFAASARDFRAP